MTRFKDLNPHKAGLSTIRSDHLPDFMATES